MNRHDIYSFSPPLRNFWIRACVGIVHAFLQFSCSTRQDIYTATAQDISIYDLTYQNKHQKNSGRRQIFRTSVRSAYFKR